jgi:hypothetical protein
MVLESLLKGMLSDLTIQLCLPEPQVHISKARQATGVRVGYGTPPEDVDEETPEHQADDIVRGM